MQLKKKYKPVLLVILDGFGISPDRIGSPWEITKHPAFSEIEKFYPFTALQASGIAVGLPWGKEGNSEVGHLTIGAGRIILNSLPRISTAINDGSFFANKAFLSATEHVKTNGSSLHLMGLFSSGTVHAYSEHLYALLDFAKQEQIKNVFLHLFTDGKDAYYKEGADFFKKLEADIKKNYPNVKIASIIGRKFAMDRDGNWDRIKKAYELFVNGKGEEFEKSSEYIKSQYQKEIFDESTAPAKIEGGEGRISGNDAVIFFNFREDSARQITRAFVDEKFQGFERKLLNNLFFVTMTEYEKNIPVVPAFKSARIEYPLGRIISEAELKQLHIAESEKYAHITYFLNGGREAPFENENRILVPSLRVPSYDQAPEMSADKITNAVIANLEKQDFIAVNFANADMVGHTGNFEATAKAFEKIDECIGKILPKILGLGGAVIITADHGNAEEKIYKTTGEKKSMHSINPVPLYLISSDFKKEKNAVEEDINKQYKDVKGTLTDIAPTVLNLLGLKKPPSMTGQSLVKKLLS